MNMKITADMSVAHIRRINFVEPIIRADRGRNIIIESLQRIIHVAILAYFPIQLFQIAFHEIIGIDHGFEIAHFVVLIAINNVGLGDLDQFVFNQNFFNQVLNFFYCRY